MLAGAALAGALLVLLRAARLARDAGRERAAAERAAIDGARADDADARAAQEADVMLRFAAAIAGPASLAQLQGVIARHLPSLVGVERAWVVARIADRQHAILPDPSATGADAGAGVFGAEPAQWATFPLRTETDIVGVLGVDVTTRRLSSGAVKALRGVGPVIAQALLTADTVDRLREASILDPLTGCSTRPHGIQRLTIELKRAARSGTPLALVMVDIDHFKEVNDRFGHNAGDAVLTSVGATMMQTLRASDVRCRWGGEEFLIVLPEAAVEQARQVAEALLRRIADTQVVSKAGPIRITASAGITVARPGEHDVETLIGRADRALYRAKAEGRACVRIVLGDFKGAPIGNAERPAPAPALPFRDRRDPARSDRRRIPGPGRRKTDQPLAWPDAEGVRRSAGDRATPRSAAPVRIPPTAG